MSDQPSPPPEPGATRRQLLARLAKLGLIAGALGLGTTTYATAVEPFRHRITRYALTPRRWPRGLNLRIALLTDIHAHPRFLDEAALAAIVAQTNDLQPDLTLCLGDYSSQEVATIPPERVVTALARLRARYGTYAIQGNHDWTDDLAAQRRGHGPTLTETAFRRAGIPFLEGEARRLPIPGHALWLAGVPSEYAIRPGAPLRRSGYRSQRMAHTPEILAAALRDVPEDAPVLLMAHEPDVFAQDLDSRIALQVSGHTHGGQIRLFGWSPFIPSRYGMRYAYGHIQEGGRDLIVSSGLGSQCLLGRPVRLGAVPEIVMLDLGSSRVAADAYQTRS